MPLLPAALGQVTHIPNLSLHPERGTEGGVRGSVGINWTSKGQGRGRQHRSKGRVLSQAQCSPEAFTNGCNLGIERTQAPPGTEAWHRGLAQMRDLGRGRQVIVLCLLKVTVA